MAVIDGKYLIERIAETFSKEPNIDTIKHFLNGYRAPENLNVHSNSHEEYIRNRIKNLDMPTLMEMAKQLGINDTSNFITTRRAKERALHGVKAFISHSTKDRRFANKLSDTLGKYDIKAFVSGKHIKGGEEWRERIRTELHGMHFFIAMHTDNFSNSLWCQQETGLALAKKIRVEIIPINFSKGNPRESFLDEFQYIKRGQKNVETIAREILSRLKDSNRTKDLYTLKIEPKVKNLF